MASSNDGCGVGAFHQLSFWLTLGLLLADSFLSLIPLAFSLTLDGYGVGAFHQQSFWYRTRALKAQV